MGVAFIGSDRNLPMVQRDESGTDAADCIVTDRLFSLTLADGLGKLHVVPIPVVSLKSALYRSCRS